MRIRKPHEKQLVVKQMHRLYLADLSVNEALVAIRQEEEVFKQFDDVIEIQLEERRAEYDYDGEDKLYIVGYREETDDEFKRRQENEAKHQKQRDAYELAQYEALKKKFEGK